MDGTLGASVESFKQYVNNNVRYLMKYEWANDNYIISLFLEIQTITWYIYTTIRIHRCTFDLGIVSITTKPYIL